MKKIFVGLLVLLLLGGGGGAFYYLYFVPAQLEVTEEGKPGLVKIPEDELFLVQVPSFKVPVLHNKVAVKVLVFHLLLNMSDNVGQTFARVQMPQLLDLYIRYLVAHYELNEVNQRIDGRKVKSIIKHATEEALGGIYQVDQVIIQGVYETR